MMWLAVDSGNTCIKWALFRGAEMLSCDTSKSPKLTKLVAAAKGREVWLSHVGDKTLGRQLQKSLSGRRLVWVRSQAKAAGVVNRYQPPEALGSDRWLCLLAAQQKFRRVVVVSVGTAVTVDLLEEGVFVGGMILPSMQLMATGLHNATALPILKAQPSLSLPPTNTQAAMAAGGVMAVSGAVREFRRRCAPRAPLLLTGGGGEALLPWLPKARYIPNLVLHGIARLYMATR